MRLLIGFYSLLACLCFHSEKAIGQQNAGLFEPSSIETPLVVDLQSSGPNAPGVTAFRDDRVITLELDYVQGNPWTPFDMGDDELGPLLDPMQVKLAGHSKALNGMYYPLHVTINND